MGYPTANKKLQLPTTQFANPYAAALPAFPFGAPAVQDPKNLPPTDPFFRAGNAFDSAWATNPMRQAALPSPVAPANATSNMNFGPAAGSFVPRPIGWGQPQPGGMPAAQTAGTLPPTLAEYDQQRLGNFMANDPEANSMRSLLEQMQAARMASQSAGAPAGVPASAGLPIGGSSSIQLGSPNPMAFATMAQAPPNPWHPNLNRGLGLTAEEQAEIARAKANAVAQGVMLDAPMGKDGRTSSSMEEYLAQAEIARWYAQQGDMAGYQANRPGTLAATPLDASPGNDTERARRETEEQTRRDTLDQKTIERNAEQARRKRNLDVRNFMRRTGGSAVDYKIANNEPLTEDDRMQKAAQDGNLEGYMRGQAERYTADKEVESRRYATDTEQEAVRFNATTMALSQQLQNAQNVFTTATDPEARQQAGAFVVAAQDTMNRHLAGDPSGQAQGETASEGATPNPGALAAVPTKTATEIYNALTDEQKQTPDEFRRQLRARGYTPEVIEEAVQGQTWGFGWDRNPFAYDARLIGRAIGGALSRGAAAFGNSQAVPRSLGAPVPPQFRPPNRYGR